MNDNNLNKIRLDDHIRHYKISTKHLLINVLSNEVENKICSKDYISEDSFFEIYRPKTFIEKIKTRFRNPIPEYLIFMKLYDENKEPIFIEKFSGKRLYNGIYHYQFMYDPSTDTKEEILLPITTKEVNECYKNYNSEDLLLLSKIFTEFYNSGKRSKEKLRILGEMSLNELKDIKSSVVVKPQKLIFEKK